MKSCGLGWAGDHVADVPLGRVDIPIKEIMREAARPRGMRLASAAKIAYKLRQASQRARERVAEKRAGNHLRCAILCGTAASSACIGRLGTCAYAQASVVPRKSTSDD